MQSSESKMKPPESSLRKWSKILLPLWGIRAGLAITARTLFRKKITVQYPEQRINIDPTYRGKISLLFVPGTKDDICISCMQCMNICPVECIHIVPRIDENKKRRVSQFDVDLNKCLFCAMCEETCPEYCIVLDPVYDYSSYTHDGLYITVEGLSREATPEEFKSMADSKEKKKSELAAKRAKKAGASESGD
jgi:NADH-quinone oxidoreductase subunit I